jgi:hypothetical protein
MSEVDETYSNSTGGSDVEFTRDKLPTATQDLVNDIIDCQSWFHHDIRYVFKVGCVTGLTRGKFHGIYAGGERHGYNGNLWTVIIDWEKEEKFAAPGDCGSVYFYVRKGLKIPFAVHIASGKLTTAGVSNDVSLGAPLHQLRLRNHTMGFDVALHSNFIQFTPESELENLLGTSLRLCEMVSTSVTPPTPQSYA